jgi:hypothetical protein
MKKLIVIVAMWATLVACDKKQTAEQAITPEEEAVLVDSIGQDIDNSTLEFSRQADSLTTEVDSLLRDI